MSLPNTITILWHICQNTPHCPNRKFDILLEMTILRPVLNSFSSFNWKFGAKASCAMSDTDNQLPSNDSA
jgi:hypothetical protein